MKKILIATGFIVSLGFFLTGCNTVAGAGQDLSAGGHALTRSADTTAQKM